MQFCFFGFLVLVENVNWLLKLMLCLCRGLGSIKRLARELVAAMATEIVVSEAPAAVELEEGSEVVENAVADNGVSQDVVLGEGVESVVGENVDVVIDRQSSGAPKVQNRSQHSLACYC